MKKLQAQYLRVYKNQNGNTVFVYKISGTADNLESYKEVQGDYYREDEEDNAPLFFTTNYFGPKGDVLITPKGKCVADMSKFEMAHSLSQQFGGNFGQEIAHLSAASILGMNPTTPVQAAPVAPVPTETELEDTPPE